MEIHAPHHAVKSLKDFLIHIVIVTIGILIALWCDGIKDRFRERQIVQEARVNFRLDADQNRAHLKAETENLDTTLGLISKLLTANPSGENAETKKLAPGFYFFGSTSWDTALSTGALVHMKPAEVMRYAEMHEAVRTYSELERTALAIYIEYSAIESGGDQSAEIVRKKRDRLLLLQQYLGIQRHLADQFSEAIEAVKRSE